MSFYWVPTLLILTTVTYSHEATQQVELDHIEYNDYVELSMELTIMFGDQKNVTLEQLHAFSKKMVRFEHNPRQQHKFAAEFLATKSDEFKKAFMEQYMGQKIKTYVTKRIESILASYMTKEHIEKLRETLATKFSNKVGVPATIAAIKEAVAKDIGSERANNAIDLFLKDLKLLYKMYSDVLEDNDNLAYLVKTEL